MNDLLTFLGLIRRAGRLEFGMDRVLSAILANRARLLLTSSDISANTLGKLKRAAGESGVKVLFLPFKSEEIGTAVGAGSTAVLAVCDAGFAKALLAKTEKKESYPG